MTSSYMNEQLKKLGTAWTCLPAWLKLAITWAIWLVIWLNPSCGVTRAILCIAALYGLFHIHHLKKAWGNLTGIFFGLAVVWSAASLGWSYYPEGTLRDLIQALSLILLVVALPAIFQTARRIWSALLISGTIVSIRLAVDWFILLERMGWPDILREARFVIPHVYNHPNITSMMAGLCILIFGARLLCGVRGVWRNLLLILGVVWNMWYLFALASRGPQAAFAMACLLGLGLLLPGWKTKCVMFPLMLIAGICLWQYADRINPRFSDSTAATFHQRDTVWAHTRMLVDKYHPWIGYGHGKKVFEQAFYHNPKERSPQVPIYYPHAHRYVLMLYFEGGIVAVFLWGTAWIFLFCRLFWYMEKNSADGSWIFRLRVRALSAALWVGLLCWMIYGLADYPDGLVRDLQFYLIGLAMSVVAIPFEIGKRELQPSDPHLPNGVGCSTVRPV